LEDACVQGGGSGDGGVGVEAVERDGRLVRRAQAAGVVPEMRRCLEVFFWRFGSVCVTRTHADRQTDRQIDTRTHTHR